MKHEENASVIGSSIKFSQSNNVYNTHLVHVNLIDDSLVPILVGDFIRGCFISSMVCRSCERSSDEH
jgi:hypothetical protein